MSDKSRWGTHGPDLVRDVRLMHERLAAVEAKNTILTEKLAEAERTLETYGKAPSWRKICKTLLGNDYWCRWLGFSPTKTAAYQKYMDLMKRRRREWQIFA